MKNHVLNNVNIFSNIAKFAGIDKCANFAYVNTCTLDAYTNYSNSAWNTYLEQLYDQLNDYCQAYESRKQYTCNNIVSRIMHNHRRLTNITNGILNGFICEFLVLVVEENYILAKKFALKYQDHVKSNILSNELFSTEFVKLLNEINYNFNKCYNGITCFELFSHEKNKDKNEKYKFLKIKNTVYFTSKPTFKFNIDILIFQKYLILNRQINKDFTVCALNTINLLDEIYGIFDHLIDDIRPVMYKLDGVFQVVPFFLSEYECLCGAKKNSAAFFARNPDRFELFMKKCLKTTKNGNIEICAENFDTRTIQKKSLFQNSCSLFTTPIEKKIYFLDCVSLNNYRLIDNESLDKLLKIKDVNKSLIDAVSVAKKMKNIEKKSDYEKPYSVTYIDEKNIIDMKNAIEEFFIEFPNCFLTGSAALCIYNFDNKIDNLFDPNDIDIVTDDRNIYDECSNKYCNATIDYEEHMYDSFAIIHTYVNYKNYKINIIYCNDNVQNTVNKFDFDFCSLLWNGTFTHSSQKAIIAANNMKCTYSFSTNTDQKLVFFVASRIWKYSCRGYKIDFEM